VPGNASATRRSPQRRPQHGRAGRPARADRLLPASPRCSARHKGKLMYRAPVYGLLLTTLALGCTRQAGSTVKPPPPPPKEDTLDLAIRMLNKATDPSSFRGPLRQVEEHAKANPKVKASLELKPEQKAALREPFNLDAADLEEVEDTTFRPLDAY